MFEALKFLRQDALLKIKQNSCYDLAITLKTYNPTSFTSSSPYMQHTNTRAHTHTHNIHLFLPLLSPPHLMG